MLFEETVMINTSICHDRAYKLHRRTIEEYRSRIRVSRIRIRSFDLSYSIFRIVKLPLNDRVSD